MKIAAIFFGIEGRLNRLSYLLLLILLAALYLLFMYIVSKVFVINNNVLPLHILKIITFIIFIFLTIKRCHDFNKSGFFMIIYVAAYIVISQAGNLLLIYLYAFSVDTLIIIMNIIIKAVFLLYIILKPGTNGKNQYGNKPEKLFDLGLNGFEEETTSINSGK